MFRRPPQRPGWLGGGAPSQTPEHVSRLTEQVLGNRDIVLVEQSQAPQLSQLRPQSWSSPRVPGLKLGGRCTSSGSSGIRRRAWRADRPIGGRQCEGQEAFDGVGA